MFSTPTITSKTAVYRDRTSTQIEFITKTIDLVPKSSGYGVKDDEILIKTAAASFNPLDVVSKTLNFSFFGLRGPFELGYDYSGEVVDIGAQTAAQLGLKVGDKVCGETANFGYKQTMTEYLKFDLPNKKNWSVTKVPSTLTMEQAASFPLVYSTAAQMVDMSHLPQSGSCKVLVNGASTSVGKYLVSLLKLDPRVDEIVGICSARSEPIVRELGADTVIDYTATENIFAAVMHRCRDRKFQAYFDCAGNEGLIDHLAEFVNAGGYALGIAGAKKVDITAPSAITRYLTFSYLKALIGSFLGLTSVTSVMVMVQPGSGFDAVNSLFEQGLIKPFVHSVHKFDNIQSAFDVLASGSNNGKIVVSF